MDALEPVGLARAIVQPFLFPELKSADVALDMLRLDLIHPVISGNKWFKLQYHLQEALQHYAQVVTYGGAWSNHLVATAYSARVLGLQAIAMVRGERPPVLSDTLQQVQELGMEIRFIPRQAYATDCLRAGLEDTGSRLQYFIPQGGAGPLGIRGASQILSLVNLEKYSHILCAVGTGTMFAGLATALMPEQHLVGISVLKGMSSFDGFEELSKRARERGADCRLLNGYDQGGYARKSQPLLDFINAFYHATAIPTDFVYTAKLCIAARELVEANYFPPGSRLLLIHSGGLQGNRSLAPGALVF